MTIKEITSLRKSGHLQEALEAAEYEFVQNANAYTVGALFWCLNDLLKGQNDEDAVQTYERMESLYNDYCTGDEYMQKTLANISRKTRPHFQELKEAVENGKKGQDIKAEYQRISNFFNTGELDITLYPDYGWLSYYALKQTPLNDAYSRKQMLRNYLKLELPKPTMLHSLILGEAIKVEQNTPLQFRIRDFIRLWGLDNLREEDWAQYKTAEGKTLPSLVEKLIGVYIKELKTDKIEAPEEFCQLVDKALNKYPQSQNMPYFKAASLISQGKIREALAYYKELILRFPSKFYLWYQTTELTDDIDTQIGLLCKALSCGVNEELLGAVRLKLASLLVQKGLQSNAKHELEKYRQTYLSNGWNLKSDFLQLYGQLTPIEAADDNTAIYDNYGVFADEFIYKSLATISAVKVAESQKEDRNHPGRKITIWILRTDKSTIRLRKPSKYGLNKRTPNGVAFDMKMLDDKVVWIKEHIGAMSEPWLKEISGEVRLREDRNGKKYAIVSGTYVGEKLLNGICDGQQIRTLSIQQEDGRWTALSIFKL